MGLLIPSQVANTLWPSWSLDCRLLLPKVQVRNTPLNDFIAVPQLSSRLTSARRLAGLMVLTRCRAASRLRYRSGLSPCCSPMNAGSSSKLRKAASVGTGGLSGAAKTVTVTISIANLRPRLKTVVTRQVALSRALKIRSCSAPRRIQSSSVVGMAPANLKGMSARAGTTGERRCRLDHRQSPAPDSEVDRAFIELPVEKVGQFVCRFGHVHHVRADRRLAGHDRDHVVILDVSTYYR